MTLSNPTEFPAVETPTTTKGKAVLQNFILWVAS